MDILLSNTPINSINDRYAKNIGNVGGNLPSLGLAMIAAYIRDKGFSIDLFDTETLKINEDDITEYIGKHRPKVFAVSANTIDFERSTVFCEKLRKEFPDMLIVIGGVHANLQPIKIMKEHACYDLLVYGMEGELTFGELMISYKNSGFDRKKYLESDLDSIKGIVFRKGSDVVRTPPMPVIENLDILPFPARDLLPMDKYMPLPNQYLRPPVVSMMVSRGCKFKCTFCNEGTKSGFMMRFRSPKLVVDEMQHVMEAYGAREVYFWDSTFSGDPDWTIELCKEIKRRKLDVTWSCFCNILGTSEEMIKEMAEAGCWNILFGIESGNEDLLLKMRKGLSLDKVRQIVKITKEAGIEIRASFMIGVPGETPEKGMNTINFAIELDPDYAQFSICTPYPGTELWGIASKEGKIIDKDFSNYHGWDSVWIPDGYESTEQLRKLEKLAMRKFYLRPKFILNKIKKIKSPTDLIRYAKGARLVAGFSGFV